MRIRFLAIGLIAGLLAACTGSKADPKPRSTAVSPSVSRTASSVSASPTQTGPLTTGPNVRPGERPPVLGAAEKQHDQTGAILTGVYYFRALDWSIATNDATAVQQVSAPTCKACGRVSAAIRTLRSNAETETGGRIRVRSFGTASGSYAVKSDYVIRVVYDEAAVRIAKRGHAPRQTIPAAHNATSDVFVSWIGDRWRVVEVAEA